MEENPSGGKTHVAAIGFDAITGYAIGVAESVQVNILPYSMT